MLRQNLLRKASLTYQSNIDNILKRFTKVTPPEDKYTEFVLNLFAGAKWKIAKALIVKRFRTLNNESVKKINKVLPEAYLEGANITLWLVDKTISPYTHWKVNKIKVKDDWIEKRLNNAIKFAAIQQIPLEKLPKTVSLMMDASVARTMEAIKQAAIYCAFDTGAYFAGQDLQAHGHEVEKTWLGIMDSRIRDSHRHLHLQTIPFNAKFHGKDGDLRFPHDPEAPASETFRCRCKMAIHLKGEKFQDWGELTPNQVYAYKRWREKAIKEAGERLGAGYNN